MSSSSSNNDHKTVTLNRTGDKMPLIGLGTWKAPKGVTSKVVETSLKIGYKLLDCAADYGNEEEVGEGLSNAIKSGYCKREDVFITSKLWNTFHAKEHVRQGCEKTLKDLKVDYLDLYLIHFPISLKYVDPKVRYPPEWSYNPEDGKMIFVDIPIEETWREMEKLVDDGLVRNIGISNFSASLIMDLFKYARIKPAVLQIEHHPYLQQETLINFVREKYNLHITAYSSFGQISYLGLGEIFNWAKSLDNLLTEQPAIQSIAKKHNVSGAQVILRWTIQRDIAVIPKSTSEERLKQNLSLYSFSLDQDDLDQMKKIDNNLRFNNPAKYANYPIFD